jgi:hypothetical protein
VVRQLTLVHGSECPEVFKNHLLTKVQVELAKKIGGTSAVESRHLNESEACSASDSRFASFAIRLAQGCWDFGGHDRFLVSMLPITPEPAACQAFVSRISRQPNPVQHDASRLSPNEGVAFPAGV